jgi:hypothetical protein
MPDLFFLHPSSNDFFPNLRLISSSLIFVWPGLLSF